MKRILVSLATLTIAGSSHASIVINIFAGELKDSSGALVAPGTLIQLVNLGPNGVFDPIDIGHWTGGDDSLITIPFGGDFPTAAAFDLNQGPDASDGIMNRVFEFQSFSFAPLTRFGMRWFPGILAQNFASATFTPFTAYGEFSRPNFGTSLHGGDPWIIPSEGSTITADSFASASIGGGDPDSLSRAVVRYIPEPTSAFLVAIGAAGLMMRRRRQS